MIKYICTVCGYVHDGDTPPEFCPQCRAPESKFRVMDESSLSLGDEHRVGIVQGIDSDVIRALRSQFQEECTEVGMYLAMARQADREGYPEIGEAYHRIALEEADHAGRMAELLGEVVTSSTQKNLELRVAGEFNTCDEKKKLANLAKQMNLDAVHDTVHEMCKDDARHFRMLEGLLKRYFAD